MSANRSNNNKYREKFPARFHKYKFFKHFSSLCLDIKAQGRVNFSFIRSSEKIRK